MTLTEARKILGLGPDEDPRPHLEEFKAVREKIADMVRTAPNEGLEKKYQEGLVEFDKALAAVREYLEALGLAPKSVDKKIEAQPSAKRGNAVFVPENRVVSQVGLPVVSQDLPAIVKNEEDDISSGKAFRMVCWILLFLTVLGFGGWSFFKYQDELELNRQARIALLERQGAIFIENRRWPEAKEAFDEIEQIDPGSELVSVGHRSIEAGMIEEQNQFIGYWKGEAIAAFEASRWDDAEQAARKVLEKYPDEDEINGLLNKIAASKVEEERQAAFDLVREQIEKRKFNEAVEGASDLLAVAPDDSQAKLLLDEARTAQAKALADLVKARELLAKAAEKDTGVFNEEAIEWLREAMLLAPAEPEVLARYEKMAAYTRTIRVPDDFATVQEALDAARDRDRLVIGEGTWEGPYVIKAGVEIEGVSGKTIAECPAAVGSVFTVVEGVRGARLSGLTIRHKEFDAGENRYSLALVKGAEADFSDCSFERGSGHGLVIIDGGHCKVMRCRFNENGWNGIAVMGAGSLLEANENSLVENYQNGIESWNGAAVILKANKCTGNSRNGIHLDNGEASATVLDNSLSSNREYGMVLSSAGSGQISGNKLEKNILGGLVIKAKAAQVLVKENTISSNRGPGLIIEKGLAIGSFETNHLSGNAGEELMSGIDFSQ